MDIVSYIKNTHHKIVNNELKKLNSPYLIELNKLIPNDISLKDKILLIRSGYNFLPKCPYCNNYIESNKGRFLKTCSSIDCRKKMKSDTMKSCSNSIDWDLRNQKTKQTNLDRIGCEWPTQNKDVRDKVKNTVKLKYGVDNVFKSTETKNKIKKTNIKKYGVDNYAKTIECKNKINLTSVLKYNSNHYLSSDKRKIEKYNDLILKMQNKLVDFNCSLIKRELETITIKCNNCSTISVLPISSFDLRLRNNINPCKKCEPPYKNGDPTISQKEIVDFLKTIYNGEILENIGKNKKSLFDSKELDIFLPDLKLGIEFNGVYWHSEKYKTFNYHIEKKKNIESKGIRLIQIWSDDWYDKNKNLIIKSRLKNLLNKNEFKLGARQFIVKKVKYDQKTKDFMDHNHLQGKANATVYYTLQKNNEIFALASFKRNKNKFELKRFVTKQNYSINGALSKLLKSFFVDYPNANLYSYADLDWSPLENSVYEKTGFKKIKITKPSYYWIIKGIRKHRQLFMKHKLKDIKNNETEVEYMNRNGFLRVFNSGNILFEYQNNK